MFHNLIKFNVPLSEAKINHITDVVYENFLLRVSKKKFEFTYHFK